MVQDVHMISKVAYHDGDAEKKPRSIWWRVMLMAMGFYILGIFLLLFTGNTNLFPTVVMLGSFMIPITYVAFFYDHRHLSQLKLGTIAYSFMYGGLISVFASSIVEPLLINTLNPSSMFLVGLIEELAKILGVLWIARRLQHNSEMDGLLLGAAVGMGFAALESMGYSFSVFLSSGGSLGSTVGVTMVRGLLSPLGHGTWTAILAAILFRESKLGRFHFNWKVIGAYLGVASLHGAWDFFPMMLANVTTSGLEIFLGQGVVGLFGLAILVLIWRDARRRDEQEIIIDQQAAEIVGSSSVEGEVEQDSDNEANQEELTSEPPISVVDAAVDEENEPVFEDILQ